MRRTKLLRKKVQQCRGLDYLRAFEMPAGLVEIQTEGGAGDTVSVVERALELRAKALQNRRPFAHVWCVIDRDEHPLDRYQRAFNAAAGRGKGMRGAPGDGRGPRGWGVLGARPSRPLRGVGRA